MIRLYDDYRRALLRTGLPRPYVDYNVRGLAVLDNLLDAAIYMCPDCGEDLQKRLVPLRNGVVRAEYMGACGFMYARLEECC